MREYAVIETTSAEQMQQQIDDGVTALGYQLLGPVQVVMAGAGMSGMAVKYVATMYKEITSGQEYDPDIFKPEQIRRC